MNPKAQGIVLDASVLINFVATGRMAEILAALDLPALVVEQAFREVNVDPRDRSRCPGLLQAFVAERIIERVKLPDFAIEVFLDLVSDGSDDLGDGESATIAYAAASSCMVALDDARAVGVCRRRFGHVPIASSIDILRDSRVCSALGEAGLADCVYSALRLARMRVPRLHEQWVRGLLSPEMIDQCPSLRRRNR